MNKKIIIGITILIVLGGAILLILNLQNNTPKEPENNEIPEQTNPETSKNVKVKITVNGKTLEATLYDNATTRDLITKLPLTLDMKDLYDREMCYEFEEELAYDNAIVRPYEVGEIIYYPPMHSFVFLYKQNGEKFQMQLVGKFDNGIETFETTGDAQVKIELAE